MTEVDIADAASRRQLMNAAVLSANRVIEMRREPVPDAGADELLVRVLATGVCGSDLSTYRGTHPYKSAPTVLGHELCGVVESVGTRVAGISPGDLVCSAAFSACEQCSACRGGAVHLCSAKRNLSHLDWSGSFADRVLLHRNMTHLLPPGTDPLAGALVEPLSIGLHAVRLLGPAEGRALAVLGGGTIGLACVLAAGRLGFGRTACVDRGSAKGKLATDAGADCYLDAEQGDPAGRVLEAFDGPVGAVIVAAGYPAVLDQAVRIVAPGGVIVVVSYFEQPMTVDPNVWVGRELTVRGSALSTPDDFETVIGWLRDGSLDPRFLVTHQFPLEEAAAALELLDSSGAGVGKVVLRPAELSHHHINGGI